MSEPKKIDVAAQASPKDGLLGSQAIGSGPLTEFTVFPKLPPELRKEIFKHATSNGSSHVIALYVDFTLSPVDAATLPVNAATGAGLFSVSIPNFSINYHITVEQFRDKDWVAARGVNLLQACRESRAACLETFKHFLGFDKGVIYFDKDTRIFIENMVKLNLSKTVKQGKTDFEAMQEIRHGFALMLTHTRTQWLDGVHDNYPNDIVRQDNGIGLPALQGRTISCNMNHSDVEVKATLAIGFLEDLATFEDTLHSQHFNHRAGLYSQPFYIGIDRLTDTGEFQNELAAQRYATRQYIRVLGGSQ